MVLLNTPYASPRLPMLIRSRFSSCVVRSLPLEGHDSYTFGVAHVSVPPFIYDSRHHSVLYMCWTLTRQSESPGEESSRVYYIGFRGDTRTPRKDTSTRLDLAAANAADAPVDKLAEKSASSQTTIR